MCGRFVLHTPRSTIAKRAGFLLDDPEIAFVDVGVGMTRWGGSGLMLARELVVMPEPEPVASAPKLGTGQVFATLRGHDGDDLGVRDPGAAVLADPFGCIQDGQGIGAGEETVGNLSIDRPRAAIKAGPSISIPKTALYPIDS